MRQGIAITVGFVVYVCVRALLWHMSAGYLIDDAYITLRYAQNLAEEGSLTYHVGERIYGISTISYPLLLAGIKGLLPLVDLVDIDVGVNIILEYLCLLVLIRLYTTLSISTPLASLIALATLWNPFFLSSSQGGMETPFFLLWLLLAMTLVDESLVLAALCAGMALLTRPDGAIAIAAVGFIAVRRSAPLAVYAILGASVVLFLAFFFIGYRTLYPASVEIKHTIGGREPLNALIYFLKAPALIIPFGRIPWMVSTALVYAAAVYGMICWSVRRYALIYGMSILILNMCLYSIANPPVWYWYVAPLVTFVALFCFFGLYQRLKKFQRLLPLLLVIWLAMEVRWVYLTPGTLVDSYTHRVAKYYGVVKKLEENYGLTPSNSIFTHEIGALGYFSKAHIYDAVGLINPSVAHLGRELGAGGYSHYGLATKAFLTQTQPDYIILQSNLFSLDTHEDGFLEKHYSHLFDVPDSAISPDSGDIQVYRMRGLRSMD